MLPRDVVVVHRNGVELIIPIRHIVQIAETADGRGRITTTAPDEFDVDESFDFFRGRAGLRPRPPDDI